MDRAYDRLVRKHYDQVAAETGDSPSSTMADDIVRHTETQAILDFLRDTKAGGHLLDAGCGNGFTLSAINQRFPAYSFTGCEPNAALRKIAQARDIGPIEDWDIRSPLPGKFDVIICQRVLINLLNRQDQERARDNLIRSLKPHGFMLFIECFQSGLDRLNQAREEFDLLPLPPAEHNLYLPDDFFAGLIPYESPYWLYGPNHLSTHYYVSRVLHPSLSMNRPFKRNSAFVHFMSKALPPSVGDFAPLKIMGFINVR